MPSGAGRPRARALTLARAGLAALVVLGFGTAATAAAWRDDVSATATAKASSFDIWSRFDTTAKWEDVGLPGGPDTFEQGFEVVLPPVVGALPATNYIRMVRLCNAGEVDGEITHATLTSNGVLVSTPTIEVDGIDVGSIIPARSCPADPKNTDPMPNALQGDIHFTTTTDWGPAQYGQSDRIVIKLWVRSVA